MRTTVNTLAEPATWTGHPRGGLRFQRGDSFTVPFSLLWAGFVFVVVTGIAVSPQPKASGNQSTAALGVLGLSLFVCVALYTTIGRFLFDMYVRSQTTYELRGASAVIRREGIFGNTSEVYLPSVGQLTLDLSRDGSGTIYFGPQPSFWNSTGLGQRGPNSPAFLMIDRAQEIFDRCKALQRGSS